MHYSNQIVVLFNIYFNKITFLSTYSHIRIYNSLFFKKIENKLILFYKFFNNSEYERQYG